MKGEIKMGKKRERGMTSARMRNGRSGPSPN